LVRRRSGEFLFILQDIKVLLDADEERTLQLSFLLQPDDFVLV